MSGEERECFQLEYQTRLEAGGAGRDLDMVRPHTGELSPAEKHSTGEGEGRAVLQLAVPAGRAHGRDAACQGQR